MPEPTIVLRGDPGFGEIVEGPLLISQGGFSPRYDLDRNTGVISRADHDLRGRHLAGAILVCSNAKGGVAAGWALLDLKVRGLAPIAMVFEVVNPVFVQGCVFADIPIVTGLHPSPTAHLRSGQWARLDPSASELTMCQRTDNPVGS